MVRRVLPPGYPLCPWIVIMIMIMIMIKVPVKAQPVYRISNNSTINIIQKKK